MNLFSRKPLDNYRRFVTDIHGEEGLVVNGLVLSPEQMAVILQLYDYGVSGISEEEVAVFNQVVDQLKTLIWS